MDRLPDRCGGPRKECHPSGLTISARTTPAEKTSDSGIELFALGLLRRHVGRGARYQAPLAVAKALGDAEVHDHHPARSGDHDVLGLDVAMDEACIVDGFETGQELRGDLSCLVEVQRRPFLENLLQRRAVDVLHRHQLLTVELLEIEDPADVGRDHLARRADLLAQGLEGFAVFESARCAGP